MSNDSVGTVIPPTLVVPPLSMRDLATVLVKHYEIHEGSYDLLIEFQIGTGHVGPDPANLAPGAMIGISKIGLARSAGKEGPTTVNAAIVNPAKKAHKKTKK